MNGGTGVHTSQTAEEVVHVRIRTIDEQEHQCHHEDGEVVGTEYNLRVFQIQFGGGEDYEFSMPHFADDRDH
ncbi:hypothetical protein A0126_18805 (plasmid) [Exiguobacterium sp. N4-1P]|uniref:hypothetical protein n=1 Tax=Exiguobacterium sp. N4-1P TaxID=2051906 RepID=UPI000B596FEE|nr:hypothetical protein [Exiguobacterium sp. N4-1P]ASI36866.1 hypothetical protein A0126_15125 [Exiguobacterium sp. N4-1P]ASI37639.1 hypothetical protein A0126_18805 [Exiguobacterium sp. N4-1P]